MQQREERGYTLVELVIVVTVLVVIAAIAVPASTQDTDKKLELAAAEFASAMRFARSEAIRTGNVHGVRVEKDNERFAVATADLTVQPFGTAQIIRHPLTRQLYDVDLDDAPNTGIVISNNQDVFHYSGFGRSEQVAFGPDGMPVYPRPLAGETYHLTTGNIRLSLGEHDRTVKLHNFTGRVTVQ